MSALAPPPCPAHPSAPAAWRCPACDRDLCTSCAAAAAAGKGRLVVCGRCGTLAEVLTAPRSAVQPFADSWGAALRPVFTWQAFLLTALFTVVSEFLMRAGPRTWLIGQALELGWILIALRRGGRDRAPFALPHWDDLSHVFVGAFPRLLASAGLLALGAAVVSQLGPEQVPPTSPAAWLLAAGAALLVPPALIFSSVEGHGERWLAPWQLGAAELRLQGDLWPVRALVAVWAGLTLVHSFLPVLDLQDTHMLEMIVGGAWLHFFALGSLAAAACLGGWLLLTRSEELEHGEPEGWRAPLVPGAEPAGAWKPAPQVEVDVRPAEPIALEDPREALLAAIAAGDAAQVTERWMRGEVRGDALDDEAHVRIAQAFAATGRHGNAANHLRALLHRKPGSPLAPRAMVLLARLCDEKLGAPDEAQALYRGVVERFPGTDAARFAQGRLPAG